MLEKFELSSRQWAQFKQLLPVNKMASLNKMTPCTYDINNQLRYIDIPLLGSQFNDNDNDNDNDHDTKTVSPDKHPKFFRRSFENLIIKVFKKWQHPYKGYLIIDTTLIRPHLNTVNCQDTSLVDVKDFGQF